MNKKAARPGENSRLSNFIFHLSSLVISAAVLLYLGYHFINSFSSDIETEYALLVTESDVISLDAYILRSETVLYSTEGSSGGALHVGYPFPDGTKVSVGSAVANVYSGSGSGSSDAILAIDKQLDLLEASIITEGITSSDTSVIDTRIANYYYTIRQTTELGGYSNLQKRRDELLTLMNKRKLITGSQDSYDSVIDDLQYQRDLLTSQYGSITDTIVTETSGYFYSELDGYETIFTADKANNMSFELFDQLTNAAPVNYSSGAVGKLATDFSWYIVCETTSESLRYFTEGYKYTVNFPYNDESLRMTVVDIVSEIGNDRVLLVLSTTLIPEDFSFRRMQPIEIVRSSYTGYKVPISAARLVDGVQGVYVLVGSIVEFRQIDILLEMDGYYIVAPRDIANDPDYAKKLGLYDSIVTGGKGLYVGKMIS